MSRRSVLHGAGRRRTGTRGAAKLESGEELRALRAKVFSLEKEAAELRAAHFELEGERDEYVELYYAAPLPALTLDIAYHVRRLNHEAALLLGDTPERIRERTFRAYITPTQRQVLSKHLARAAASDGLQRCRLRLDLPYERDVPVEVCTRYASALGTFELRLIDLREHERMAEESRRLTDAERSAREESAAKDKFIAILSHELRAPLTPVLAAASARLQQQLSLETRELFEMIERNVAAEARLIDDLLDVNRIVRNKMYVERVATGVHRVLEQAVDNARPDANEKHQLFTLQLGAGYDRAFVDPSRLRQIFANLLKNAIKFTPTGGSIAVTTWNAESAIAIEVQDDGVGIDQGTMGRLFEPFNDERATLAGGLGLGLAICKGLVELQDGRISAQSRGRGLGSRFVVEFPTTQAEPAADTARPSERPSAAPPSSDRPSRILLVEDHADTIEVLTALLEQNGFQVQSAMSVEAALKIDLEAVDVIVSDIGLPDGTGLELMRELGTKAHRPSIALTGFGMESDVRASKAAGFDLHLTKPVSIERLVDAIHRLAPRRAVLNPSA